MRRQSVFVKLSQRTHNPPTARRNALPTGMNGQRRKDQAMTAAIYQRAATMQRPGHRQSINPVRSHYPVTEAGQRREIRRLMNEIRRLG